MITMTDPQFFNTTAFVLLVLTLVWHLLRRTLGSYLVLALTNVGSCMFFAASGEDGGLYIALAAFVFGILVVLPLTNTMGWRSK